MKYAFPYGGSYGVVRGNVRPAVPEQGLALQKVVAVVEVARVVLVAPVEELSFFK